MKQESTQTTIDTKFGRFFIRVYKDAPGKETVVLWTEKLDKTKPALVRIHSECMTGDTFGSLKCDCGPQLEQSLRLIKRDGNGALIYLRQEGRGIGLFEKIKSYKLQDKGYDTFEANLLLGHRPDLRTYEMAKMALGDLGIKSIRLLTNNPAKISEISKLGIKVTERVPLIIPANKFNQRYFATKRDKFKHFFHTDVSYYFYQFHASNTKHVEEIGKFLKNKNRDPLLKICVGVAARHQTLADKKEIKKIEEIFKICESYVGFVPILHFSFTGSKNPINDVRSIKEKMPFVKYLQTNDLGRTKLSAIKLACKLFLADIPLSDENFSLVNNKSFRETIKKYKAFLLLDNSKGRGIRESKESFMKKIDALLKYGLNDIAIFGGFGADDLDTYFELRRHYRINFSIDAESKLKTQKEVDIEKVKQYLLQLIRFDDPKQAGVEQTRIFLQQHKHLDWKTATIENNNFLIHPAVFDPSSFPSSAWFANAVKEQIRGQTSFCEVGCGTGVISCLIALVNPNIHIVATDINPFAAENTRLNAERLGVGERIEAATGDVLDGVNNNKRFDSIFWALPFGFLDPGASVTLQERQVFDPGYRSIRKFFQTAKEFLKPNGRLLIGFSSDLGHQELLNEYAKQSKIKIKKIAEQEMHETEAVIFELLEGRYLD
jgi:GTP cyclohydrolase II